MTKWKRLYNALADDQNKRQYGNSVLSFIATALQPTRYINKRELYGSMLMDVNTVLAFHGLEFRDDGKFHTIKPVSTLTEAEKRAQKVSTSNQRVKIIATEHLLSVPSVLSVADNINNKSYR